MNEYIPEGDALTSVFPGADPVIDGIGSDVSGPEPDGTPDRSVRIKAGSYLAECRAASIYRDRQFKRWTCRLRFCVYGGSAEELAELPCWLNLGNGAAPFAGPRSAYRKWWCLVTGRRADGKLSHRVFVKKLFQVEVGDVERDAAQQPHTENQVYSVVREILSVGP